MEQPTSMRRRIARLRGRFAGAGLAAVLLLSTAAFTLPPETAMANDINVTQNGVANNGTNVTTALQNLIGSGNKSLFFPSGTYRFSGISLPAGTKLTFASGANVVPVSGSTANFFAVTGNSVTVIGGAFDGQGSAGNVVTGSGRSNLLIDGVSAVGMRGSTANLSGITSSVVRNTSSRGSEYGIVLSSSSYVTLDKNYSDNMLRDGILLYSGSRFVTISNNTAERFSARGAPDTGRAGIHMYGCSDITVFGNTVRNGLYDAEGIRFRDTERFDCYDNVVDGTGGAGIAVTSMGDWYNVNGLIGGDGTIRNNTLKNNGIRGIASVYTHPRFENTHLVVKPVRIMNNYIENTWLDSRWHMDTADAIHSASRDSVVVNNTIVGSTGFGVRVGSGGARTLVADNNIRTVRNAGVGTWAANSSVIRNVINGVSSGPGISNSGTMYAEANTITSAASGSSTSNTGKLSGDSTPPTVWSDIVTSYNAGQTFTVSGSDSGTGIAALLVKVNNAPVRAYHGNSVKLDVGTAGTHVVTYWAMDRAGNICATQSRTYTVGSVSSPTDPEPAPAPEPAPTVNAPANLAGTAFESAGSSIVNLTWSDQSTNETGFLIERAYEQDGKKDAWVHIDTLPANATTYADRVHLGSVYHYRVRAFSGSGTDIVYSAYSNEARIVSPGDTTEPAPAPPSGETEPTPEPPAVAEPDPLPAAPTALSVAATRIRTVQMWWTDNATNETSYEIWCKRNGVWNLYATVPTDTTTYTTKRLPKRTYEFRVRAVNAAGVSDFSPAVSVVVQ